MKTIKTMNVDGYDIITSINSAGGFIDTENTRKIVNVEIQKTEVFKNISAIKNMMKKYITQADQARKNQGHAKKLNQADQEKKFFEEWKKYIDLARSLEDDLKPFAIELKNKFSELMIKHAVYFNLPEGETLVDDLQAETVKQKLHEAYEKDELIDKDLKSIANHKGKIFWKKTDKWNKKEIKKIGELPMQDEIEESMLSEIQKEEIQIQIEKERIAKLKTAEKLAEKNSVIEGLKQQAINMRMSLEIDGDPDALVKAQNWLSDEISRVEIKYA